MRENPSSIRNTGKTPAVQALLSREHRVVRLPRGVEERGLDVSRFEERIVREDFLVRCARREEFQHIHHTQARPADAGTPAAFARFDCDAFEEWHVQRLARLLRDTRALPPQNAEEGGGWLHGAVVVLAQMLMKSLRSMEVQGSLQTFVF